MNLLPRIKFTTLSTLLLAATAHAATYYIDFSAGNDAASGTTPETPFKHSPGDTAAAALAKNTKLLPGDTVIFKGGIPYRGTVAIKDSGAPGNPITYDGNSANTFGKTPAIIDGADEVANWKRCASPDQAEGNPQWHDIFYADVPVAPDWRRANLCDQTKPLPVSQDPKPADPMLQESIETYHVVNAKLANEAGANVIAEKGTHENSQRPLILMIAGEKSSAAIDPLVGGGFSIVLPAPVTVSTLGLWPDPNYTAPKEIAFYADGKELLTATLKKDQKDIQKFPLPVPATFTKLTVKILSKFDPDKPDFTAIKQVAAYDANGKELLQHKPRTSLTDPAVFTQSSPDYYNGMTLGFHGGDNRLLYLQIHAFDPAAHRLDLDYFAGRQYAQTRYSLFNSVKLITVPGEYSVEKLPDAKKSRLFLLPEKLDANAPASIGYSLRGRGFDIEQASDILIRGFTVKRQGNASSVSGIYGEGPAHDVTIRDCDISMVREGTGISLVKIDKPLVEHCTVHDNPGHTQGIVIHTSLNPIVKDCTLQRNTSTALVYYVATDGQVVGNTILDHMGMHANGMSFYVNCKNILIERNYVARGQAALTLQDGEGFLIRNNIFDSNGHTTVVSLWASDHMKDVKIFYNCILRSDPNTDWVAGLYTNTKSIEGLVVENNIIDGLASEGGVFKKTGVFAHNLYTRKGLDQANGLVGKAEIFEPDLAKIFLDPNAADFRLKPNSPALNAGLTSENDGSNQPPGKPINLGPINPQKQNP